MAAKKAAPADSHAHKYLDVRDYLLDLIGRDLGVGDTIPSERTLASQLGVSRMTVRQAVETLVSEGILHRRHGRGTFVAPERMDFEMRLTTFEEEMRRRGMTPSTTSLATQVVQSTLEVSEALGLDTNTPVLFCYRVRHADGIPISIEQQWIPLDLVPDPGRAPDSVYALLREQGIEPEWGEETVSAGEATDTEASLLAMGASRVVLRAQRRTYAGTRAVTYSKGCYRADRYTIWVPLAAPKPVIVPAHERPAGTTDDAKERSYDHR